MTVTDEYRKYYGCPTWSDEKIVRLVKLTEIRLVIIDGIVVLRDAIDAKVID